MKTNVLNINIDNLSWDDSLRKFKESKFIVTPNIDHLYNLKKNKNFFEVYQQADLKLCDSKILSIISPFFFKQKIQQIAGSDYFPAVCKYYQRDENFRFYLLGGSTEIHAKKAMINLKEKYNANIAGYYSPPFGFEKKEEYINKIANEILQCNANCIAVGLGSPKQELLIFHLMSLLPDCKFLAVGATIDFESGLLKRSPKLISTLGLEWFFRFLQEPRRLFKRYFVHGPQVLLQIFYSRLRR